jgi:hypothetical protein
MTLKISFGQDDESKKLREKSLKYSMNMANAYSGAMVSKPITSKDVLVISNEIFNYLEKGELPKD